MILISVGVSIPMTLLSGFLVRTLFGEAYAPAGTILSIYMWSSVFVYLGVANGRWLIAENLQVFRMRALTTAAIINIVLNYVFIKLIGLEGAALATLVSYSFSGYFCFLFSARTRPTFWQLTRSFNLFSMPKRLLHDIRQFASGK
jgi:O-antigen/teichoic acid export membrane protein